MDGVHRSTFSNSQAKEGLYHEKEFNEVRTSSISFSRFDGWIHWVDSGGVSPANEYVHVIALTGAGSPKCPDDPSGETPDNLVYMRNTDQGQDSYWETPNNSKFAKPTNFNAFCTNSLGGTPTTGCHGGQLYGAEGRNDVALWVVPFQRDDETTGAVAYRSTDNGANWSGTELKRPGGSTSWYAVLETAGAVASSNLHCAVLAAEETSNSGDADLFAVDYSSGWSNSVKITYSDSNKQDDEPVLHFDHQNGSGYYHLVWDLMSLTYGNFTNIEYAREGDDTCDGNWSQSRTVESTLDHTKDLGFPRIVQNYLGDEVHVAWTEADVDNNENPIARIRFRRNTNAGASADWGTTQTLTDWTSNLATHGSSINSIAAYNAYLIVSYSEYVTVSGTSYEKVMIRRNDNYGAGTATPQGHFGGVVPASISQILGQAGKAMIFSANGKLLGIVQRTDGRILAAIASKLSNGVYLMIKMYQDGRRELFKFAVRR